MRNFVLAAAFGLLLTFVVIGVLSISPILDSSAGDIFITKALDRLLPPPSSKVVSVVAKPGPMKPATLQNQTDQPAHSQVLGLQTAVSPLSSDKIYGLINGERRDHKQEPLQISTTLEKEAAEINASRGSAAKKEPLSEAFTIQKYGYRVKNYALFEALNVDSEWGALQSWIGDAISQKQLRSPSFSEMGVSILCATQKNTSCSVLLITATPQ